MGGLQRQAFKQQLKNWKNCMSSYLSKIKRKCDKCGKKYTLYTTKYEISKHTFGQMFFIDDENGKEIRRGIAVNHC